MTIRKGQEWGSIAKPLNDVQTIASNHELRALIEAARGVGDAIPTVGLLGGDLMRTLGGSAEASRFCSGDPVPHLPVDVVHVVADHTREGWFVAHLLARHSWWHGQLLAAMNAQFLGKWDVSPRCHPNDGLVDIVTVAAEMRLQQRWMARSRAALGTHVPHPLITIKQCSSVTLEFERHTPLWLDGARWGSARHLQLVVEPDAFVACV